MFGIDRWSVYTNKSNKNVHTLRLYLIFRVIQNSSLFRVRLRHVSLYLLGSLVLYDINIYCYFICFHSACPTPFSGFNTLSNEEIEDLITKLRVSKNSTSSYRRSITSAHDDRKSSQMIGIGGIIFLASIVCVVVLPDIFKVFTYFFRHRKT